MKPFNFLSSLNLFNSIIMLTFSMSSKSCPIQALGLHKMNTFCSLKILFLSNSQTFKNFVCRSQLAYLSCIHAYVWFDMPFLHCLIF